jgi:hypothetical protein
VHCFGKFLCRRIVIAFSKSLDGLFEGGIGKGLSVRFFGGLLCKSFPDISEGRVVDYTNAFF